ISLFADDWLAGVQFLEGDVKASPERGAPDSHSWVDAGTGVFYYGSADNHSASRRIRNPEFLRSELQLLEGRSLHGRILSTGHGHMGVFAFFVFDRDSAHSRRAKSRTEN